MSTAHLQQEDFPVGFAEHQENYYQIDDNTVFYVEWLDNSSEFPGLSSSATDNLDGGNWELLQRKEFNDDEHTLIPVEDYAWSKLTTPGSNELYANVAEKNAAELQPKKRTIQPLWTNTSKKTTNKKEDEDTEIDEDAYQDDLSHELLYIQKSQSRRANRYTARRKLHDLKTIDLHVEGVLRLATSRQGATDATWIPYEKNMVSIEQVKPEAISTHMNDNLAVIGVKTRSQALTFSAKFTQNMKRYTYKYATGPVESKRPPFPDNCEYSVHSAIVRQ